MPEAIIFDIQRGSFVDGPGIRTVVFFKGCNLRCRWCHNPESWLDKPQLAYFRNRCVQCGACRSVCPVHAVGEDCFTDGQLCLACGRCEQVCPAGARKLYGRRMGTREIFDCIALDRAFYESSGGGVTLSGGECLLQEDAVKDLLIRCRAEGIHSAVDTAGNVPWECFEQVYDYTDLFLYDIKCLTDSLHQQLTGVSNRQILENYVSLWHRAPEKLIVRIPVVPGENDLPGEMEQIAEFLTRYRPARVELLPYHRMGESKAEALKLNTCRASVPTEEHMDALRRLFEEAHL